MKIHITPDGHITIELEPVASEELQGPKLVGFTPDHMRED